MLIVLRGNSGAGKATVAVALQQELGQHTAVLGQDHFRRVIRLEAFHEGKTIPWRALPNFVESPAGYVHPGGSNALPLEFSVVARKP